MNESDKRREELITRESSKPGLRGRVNAFCISCIVEPGAGDEDERTEAAVVDHGGSR